MAALLRAATLACLVLVAGAQPRPASAGRRGALTTAALRAPPPPQVSWPPEYRAACNESIKGVWTVYDTEFSEEANAEQRITKGVETLTDHNSSRTYVIERGPPASCTESPSSFPLFKPDLSTFKYAGTDNGPFSVPTQLWIGTIEGQAFYYHCTTDGKQTPVGFCGEDDSVGVCIHWVVFVPATGGNAFQPGYFDPPSDCPQEE